MAKTDTSKMFASTNYGEATGAEVKEAMRVCWKASQPLCIISPPGCGKTAIAMAFAQLETGLPATIVLGSVSDPTDVSGVPAAGTLEDKDGNPIPVTDFLAPRWQVEVATGRSKVLLFDEFTNSVASVQASLLNLIQSRITPGGYRIPDDVLIVMAANPESSAADYNPITAPMANRITFISYKPTDEEFYDGMLNGWDGEDMESVSEDEKAWRERIVAFLQHNHGTYILKELNSDAGVIDSQAGAWLHPDAESSDSEREILTSAWCSPRSWTNAARMLSYTGFNSRFILPFQERLLAGTVGREAQVMLSDYVRSHANIDPLELILNPEIQNWKSDDQEGSQYNDLVEIARMVDDEAERILWEIKKNGEPEDGTPGALDILDFYSKVVDLGGGYLFANSVMRKKNGPGSLLKTVPPKTIVRDKWWKDYIGPLMKKFVDGNFIVKDKSE